MSDKKNSQTEYTTVKPVVKFESTVMPHNQVKETAILTKKQKKLVLDEAGYKPSKTRAELYNELQKDEIEKTAEDLYQLATFPARGLALGIDAVFTGLLVNAAIVLAPYELDSVKYLLDFASLDTIFSDSFIIDVSAATNILIFLYAGVVLPMVLFNCTLGKKLTHLRVRGDDVYTLSVSKCFQRELILKPLGALCILGFVMPFFDEKKKSFHDKLAKTFVIKD